MFIIFTLEFSYSFNPLQKCSNISKPSKVISCAIFGNVCIEILVQVDVFFTFNLDGIFELNQITNKLRHDLF